MNPVQLNMTIAAVRYDDLTNRFAGGILFERNIMARKALDQRLDVNIETVMRLVEA